jgi:hypothetical protein
VREQVAVPGRVRGRSGCGGDRDIGALQTGLVIRLDDCFVLFDDGAHGIGHRRITFQID